MVERATPHTPDWDELAHDHLARYYYACQHVVGLRVLDSGAGAGYGSALLRAAGAACVQGVDIDPETVEHAKARFGGEGIAFIVDDCERLFNITMPVDLICSFENIEHLNNPMEFLMQARRVLTPDGVLLCSTPERAAMPPFQDGRPVNSYHMNEWYRDEFRQMLVQHFNDVEIRVQVRLTSLDRRKRALAHLNSHLNYLWQSPGLKMTRYISHLFGKPTEWLKIEDLILSAPGDYPVVPESIVPLLGTAWCNLAICRKPKRI